MGDALPGDMAPDPGIIAARPIAAAPPTPEPLTLPTLTRRQAVLDLGLVAVAGLVVPGGFELAARLSLVEPALPQFDWLIVTHQWFAALLALSLAAYLVYRHGLPAAAFGLQADHLGRQLLWAALTLVGLYCVLGVLAIFVGALTALVPGLEEDVAQRKEFLELLPVNDLTATLLLMLPVALHEEMLFRGLLLPYLRRVGCGWAGAALLSTGIFALLHIDQGWLGILQVFGVGLVLAVCFLWSRSLLAVVLAHFAFNVVQVQVVVRWLMPLLEGSSDGG